MLLTSVDDAVAFRVIGVEVTRLFGALELDYADIDDREFAAGASALSAEAAVSDHQGVVVRSPPGHTLRPHFHGVPQFQVFYDGVGTIGRHDVAPLTVHYADAFTPYGPIVSGPTGLAYAVLRPRADVGAHWMPEERAALPGGGPPRRFTVRLERSEVVRAGASTHDRELVAPTAEHPAAVRWVHLGPGEGAELADPPDGTTTLLALIGGSLLEGCTGTAPAFGHGSGTAAEVRAGPRGADLLVLVTPIEAARR